MELFKFHSIGNNKVTEISVDVVSAHQNDGIVRFLLRFSKVFVNGKCFSIKNGIYFSRYAANYFPEFAAFYFPQSIVTNTARVVALCACQGAFAS